MMVYCSIVKYGFVVLSGANFYLNISSDSYDKIEILKITIW